MYINQSQYTPLHYAAEKGHGKIVETLVEAKADLHAQDEVSVLRLDGDVWCNSVWCNSVFCPGTHDTIAR